MLFISMILNAVVISEGSEATLTGRMYCGAEQSLEGENDKSMKTLVTFALFKLLNCYFSVNLTLFITTARNSVN